MMLFQIISKQLNFQYFIIISQQYVSQVYQVRMSFTVCLLYRRDCWTQSKVFANVRYVM